MLSKLEEFRQEMEPLKKEYTKELEEFAEKYDFLGDLTIIEDPDIDTLDYIFSFEKLNGTSKETLDSAIYEIRKHMFSYTKANNLEDFAENAYILYDWCLL